MRALFEDVTFVLCELLVLAFTLFFACVFASAVLFAIGVLIAGIVGLL